MTLTQFKFTFETEQEQFEAERTGYIDAYDCVRMEVSHPDGGSVDFPVKNRESFDEYLALHWGQITKIYPTVHSYDVQDYL